MPPKLIAGVFYGSEALVGGALAVVVGLMVHMVVSGSGGMVLGLALGPRAGALKAMAAGLGLGIVMWAVMTWLVLPWANPLMLERQMAAPGWWFGLHLIYGGTLAVVPGMIRALAGQREAGLEGDPLR